MSTARTLTDFIRALRSAEIPVSPAEAIDAAGALNLIGYANRLALKSALRPTLAKSPSDSEAYDRLFDLYFAPPRSPQDSSDTASDNDADNESADGGGEPPESFADLAQSGDEGAMAAAMARAAQAAGVQYIRFSTQTAFYAQKMLKELGVEELEAELLQRLQAHTPEDDAAANQLIEARRDMMRRARAHVEGQFQVFGTGATETFRDSFLANKPITALDRSDLNRMRGLVEKVAKRLAVKHSRRRRRRNVGVLDVRRTLRSNAGLGGVPFDIHWKQKKRDRPKIVCICDVSSSVSRHVRFLLLLLHSLGDVIPDLKAYAFSARLGDITDRLDSDHFEGVMESVLRDYGMGSTDYGQALSDFDSYHRGAIDRRTTVIILGDGRSNYGDPRMDLFRDMAARSKRLIWLSPEAESMWGTGDSELHRYQVHCDGAGHVTTLQDLERTLDRVLATYN